MQTENYEDSLVGNEKMMLMAKKVRMIMTLFSGTWTRRSKWLCGGRAGGENQCLLRSTSNIYLSCWDRLLTSKLTKFYRKSVLFALHRRGKIYTDFQFLCSLVIINCRCRKGRRWSSFQYMPLQCNEWQTKPFMSAKVIIVKFSTK